MVRGATSTIARPAGGRRGACGSCATRASARPVGRRRRPAQVDASQRARPRRPSTAAAFATCSAMAAMIRSVKRLHVGSGSSSTPAGSITGPNDTTTFGRSGPRPPDAAAGPPGAGPPDAARQDRRPAGQRDAGGAALARERARRRRSAFPRGRSRRARPGGSRRRGLFERPAVARAAADRDLPDPAEPPPDERLAEELGRRQEPHRAPGGRRRPSR